MENDRANPLWPSILVGIVFAIASQFLWKAMDRQEGRNIDRLAQLAAARVKSEISAQIETQTLALVRLARRWEVRGGTPREEWESDASLYTRHMPGFQAIEWLDPSFQERWIVPMEGNEAVRFFDLHFEERRKNALEMSRDRRGVVVTRALDLVQGGKGFQVNVPVFEGADFGGFMIGIFRVQELFDFILHQHVAAGYAIAVYDDEEEIYKRGDIPEEGERWRQDLKIDLYGVSWTVRVWPMPDTLTDAQSLLPEVTLVSGLLMAVLLALSVYLYQTARFRAEALRESEARFRDLYDEAPVGYHEIDTEGRFRRVNRTAQTLLGYTEQEMLGRHPWEFIVEQEASRRAIQEKLAGSESPRSYGRTWRRKDGSVMKVLMQDKTLRDADGRVAGVRAIVQDITEPRDADSDSA